MWGTAPAEAAGLRGTLGTNEAGDVHLVPVIAGAGDGTGAWPDPLAGGQADLVLCPVGPALQVRSDAVEIVGMTRRAGVHDVLLGPAGVDAPPEAALRRGAVVAAPCARSAGLARAHYPGVCLVRAEELGRDLARVDRAELAAVIATCNGHRPDPHADRTATVLPVAEWVPAPGSGALAILMRAGTAGAAAEAARAMAHGDTTRAVSAEVAVARALGTMAGRGVGVIAAPVPEGLRLAAMVVSEDGRQLVRGRVVARDGAGPSDAAARLVGVLRRRGVERVGGVAGEYAWRNPRREGSA